MAGEKTIYNLGINTTLSRKLLHFQPDVKIAQTIEFFAGQRSTMEQVYQRFIVRLRFPPFSKSPISITVFDESY